MAARWPDGASSKSFAVAGGGCTLRVTSPPTLVANSSIAVNAGELKFAATGGSANISNGVTITVASSATLELAGTVPALTGGPNGVAIINSGTGSAGVVVSGSNQLAGAITGSGTVTVDAAGSLTANSIIQGALIIGSGGTFTLDPSDANGNPLAGEGAGAGSQPAVSAVEPGSANGATTSGFALAESLSPANSFVAFNGNMLSDAPTQSTSPFTLSGDMSGASSFPVPEPSALLLLAIGGILAAMFKLQAARATA